MSKFKVKVARIEAVRGSRPDSQVCITFEIKNGPALFQVPIHLKVSDYDDTEMIQAARSALHRMFVESQPPNPALEAVGGGAAAAVGHEFAPQQMNVVVVR